MLNNKNLYEFNKGTLAILPNGKESSLIYEDDSRYIIDDNPLKVFEIICVGSVVEVTVIFIFIKL